MEDLRSWLKEVEGIGKLKVVDGADPHLELGILAEVNCKRRGPAFIFDNIKGHDKGYRIVTGAILDAQRLGLTLGYRDITTDQELVSRLEGKVIDWERRSGEFAPEEVSDGAVMENRFFGNDVNLLKFPAPKWHEYDGGKYLGTGCVVITRDPDTGVINLGAYRLMLHDEKTLALHISSAHHGALNVKKYHARGEAAPIAVSFGHHPLYHVLAAMSVPYSISEYQFAGAIFGKPVPVIPGEITGLPIPAGSEFSIEGFSPPDERRDEGPYGEYTGYYASGREKEPVIQVKALYHRNDPIILGAMPARPPHDYSYFMSAMKSANVKDSLKKDGIPDVKGVWYHEVSGINFFTVVSIKQRYPGHARQAGFMVCQCRAGGTSMGRYVVVVDDDIDPSDLDQVIWAISTRSNPEKDIDILRNTYTGPLDPIYPKPEKISFGSRAVIDACRPFDWIQDFPRVVQSSDEEREKVMQKWKGLFD
jgi:UbiD family decarboxylase